MLLLFMSSLDDPKKPNKSPKAYTVVKVTYMLSGWKLTMYSDRFSNDSNPRPKALPTVKVEYIFSQ